MTDRPTRRDLMRPVQLLGFAFIAALFAGVVTLVSMGFFQQRPADEVQRALLTALVVAGVAFIVTLVVIALLVLAVDPAQVAHTVDRPVLLRDAPDPAAAASGDDADAADSDAPGPDSAPPSDPA